MSHVSIKKEQPDYVSFDFISKLGIYCVMNISISDRKTSIQCGDKQLGHCFTADLSDVLFVRNDNGKFFIILDDFILELNRKTMLEIKKEVDALRISSQPED